MPLQSSFSPSLQPLRLLFVCVTLLPAQTAQLRMLVPLFSPNHLKHTQTEEEEERREEKKKSEERLRGKNGADQSWHKVIFSLHLSSSFAPTSPSIPISFCPSPTLLSNPLLLLLSPGICQSLPSGGWTEAPCQRRNSPVKQVCVPGETHQQQAL